MFKLRFNKKIAFSDNSNLRFSVVRKVPYTFLHHKKGIMLFIVLGTLLIVTSLASIILSIILSHARLTHHQTSRIQAHYAAMAGVNYTLEMLRIGPGGGWAIGTNCTLASPCTMPFAAGDFKPAILINPTNGVTINIISAGSVGCASPPAPAGGACIKSTAIYTTYTTP